MEEIWKPIPNFDGYEASNLGHIRSYRKKGGGLKEIPTLLSERSLNKSGKSGYKQVNLRNNQGKTILKRIHQLVLLTFVGPCPEGMETCHGEKGSLDNSLDNLRYDTRFANAQDCIAHHNGIHPKSDITLEQATEILNLLPDLYLTNEDIAQRTNTSKGVVDGISKGDTYKRLEGKRKRQLREERAKRVFELRKTMTLRQIGNKVGLSVSMVCRILKGNRFVGLK